MTETKKECGCKKHNSDCKCKPENHCGCMDGKPCTCGSDKHSSDCKCTPENHCGCMDGKPCTCGSDKQDKKKCSCKSEANKLEEKITKLETELNETIKKANQYLSTASYYKNEVETQKKDFDRYKERNKNILNDAVSEANEKTAKKLLPIIDNFDQAMSHLDSEVKKGFSMIYSSLVACLADLDVIEIQTDGQLNPEYHDCINTEATDDASLDDTIATVYKKGYKLNSTNKTIRPATVSIYKKQ